MSQTVATPPASPPVDPAEIAQSQLLELTGIESEVQRFGFLGSLAPFTQHFMGHSTPPHICGLLPQHGLVVHHPASHSVMKNGGETHRVTKPPDEDRWSGPKTRLR